MALSSPPFLSEFFGGTHPLWPVFGVSDCHDVESKEPQFWPHETGYTNLLGSLDKGFALIVYRLNQ
jgi:hypothetical protein